MPRPKPAEAIRKFQVKLPESEDIAIGEIVKAWGASLGARNIHVVPTPTAWFRAVVLEMATRYGITIRPKPAEAGPVEVPAAGKSGGTKKQAAKRKATR